MIFFGKISFRWSKMRFTFLKILKKIGKSWLGKKDVPKEFMMVDEYDPPYWPAQVGHVD